MRRSTGKRPYTPSSMPSATRYFDLPVNRYEIGTVSKYLYEREPGDTVLMSGPNPGGHWVDGMAKRVGFMAGGTGITPMIAIIRWILAGASRSSCFWSVPTSLRPTSFSERSGTRICANTRASIGIMCWSSRRKISRRAWAAHRGRAAWASAAARSRQRNLSLRSPPMADALESALTLL
jgi:hypothetical protein